MVGYYGYRGSGKTLNLVADIYKVFIKNPDIIVITNTPLFFPPHPKTQTNLKQYQWTTIEELRHFFEFAMSEGNLVLNKPTIVIIDEANLVLPSRLFSKLPAFFLTFLAESRKLNTEIYFTTQHPARVERILKELTETWIHCQKIPFFGWTKKIEEELSPDGDLIEEFGVSLRFFHKKYYSMYNTHHIIGVREDLKNSLPAQVKPMEDFIDFHYRQDSILPPSPLPSTSSPLGGKTGEGGVGVFQTDIQ